MVTTLHSIMFQGKTLFMAYPFPFMSWDIGSGSYSLTQKIGRIVKTLRIRVGRIRRKKSTEQNDVTTLKRSRQRILGNIDNSPTLFHG